MITFVGNWIIDNQAIFQFLWLLVLSCPMYLLFRHNPRIPDIRYSEFFVSTVYITNMITIIDTIGAFFIPSNTTISFMAYALSIVPLKQLTGYSYKRTLLKAIGAMALIVIAGLILAAIICLTAILVFNMIEWK